MVNAAEGRFEAGIVMEVVASHEGDVLGNAEARIQGNIDGGDRDRIVVAKNSVGAFCGEQGAHCIVALLPVFSIRSHVGAHQRGIEFQSVFLEREFVTGKAPQPGGELQAADMRDPFASHGDQMFGCNPAHGDIVDADKIGFEAGKIAVNEDKRDFLLFQLLEFCRRITAGRNNQAIQAMAQMPDYAVWLYGPANASTLPSSLTVLGRTLNLEFATGKVAAGRFLDAYAASHDQHYLLLQGHAGMWDGESFTSFTTIVDRLSADGWIFATPSEYARLVQQGRPAPVR